jgi:hypothetical protein
MSRRPAWLMPAVIGAVALGIAAGLRLFAALTG